MNKIIPVLSLAALSIFLNACDKAPVNEEQAKAEAAKAQALALRSETEKLAKELDAQAPQDFGLGIRAPLEVAADGKGIVFRVAMKQKMFEVTNKEQLESFRKGFNMSVQNIFCAGKQVAAPMQKYMTGGHYLDFLLTDPEATPLLAMKMDEVYCGGNPTVEHTLSPEELTALTTKQKEQGFYDDEYLNQVIIANYRKQLPQQMTSELSVVNLSAVDGVLTYHVEYTPAKGKPNAVMIKALLKSIPESTCSMAPVQTLLNNIKSMVYSVETNGEVVDSISMTKESCGAGK